MLWSSETIGENLVGRLSGMSLCMYYEVLRIQSRRSLLVSVVCLSICASFDPMDMFERPTSAVVDMTSPLSMGSVWTAVIAVWQRQKLWVYKILYLIQVPFFLLALGERLDLAAMA